MTRSHAALWYLIPEVLEIFPGYMQGPQQAWGKGPAAAGVTDPQRAENGISISRG